MWKIIRKYYLFPFIGFLLVISIRFIGIKSPDVLTTNILIIIGGALLGSLIVGTLYYFQDTKWGPKKREKLMTKTPFKEFLNLGFQRKDEFIIGVIRDYTVIISFVWFTGKSAITIHVLFNPKIMDRFYKVDELIAIMKRNKKMGFFSNKYKWSQYFLGYVMEFMFTPPSYEKVIQKIDQLIDILKNEKLKPVSHSECDEFLAELKKIKGNDIDQLTHFT